MQEESTKNMIDEEAKKKLMKRKIIANRMWLYFFMANAMQSDNVLFNILINSRKKKCKPPAQQDLKVESSSELDKPKIQTPEKKEVPIKDKETPIKLNVELTVMGANNKKNVTIEPSLIHIKSKELKNP